MSQIANVANQAFTGVVGGVSQVAEVNASQVNAANVKSTSADIGLVNADELAVGPPGLVRKGAVVGYAPTSFATVATGTPLALLNVAGGAAATSESDVRLVQLPEGAVITRILASNRGTTVTSGGAATFDVGTATFAGGIGSPVMETASLATINSATGVVVLADAINSAGTARKAVTGAADGFVKVNVNTAALTAGDLKVVVEYEIADLDL